MDAKHTSEARALAEKAGFEFGSDGFTLDSLQYEPEVFAKLIDLARADLLAALQKIAVQGYYGSQAEYKTIARAAIAKATGETESKGAV